VIEGNGNAATAFEGNISGDINPLDTGLQILFDDRLTGGIKIKVGIFEEIDRVPPIA